MSSTAHSPNGLNRRGLFKLAGLVGAGALLCQFGRAATGGQGKRLNLLLITADDLNCDTVGAFGGEVPKVTPNIDRLASEGMRFKHADVTVGVCQPSRMVLMTGCYPAHTGGVGFHPISQKNRY